MVFNQIVALSLIGSCLLLSATALPTNEFPDLQGPYCQSRNYCCSSRADSCAVPILGTLCYCDEFCNSTRVHDCCPDYWSFCFNIQYETTTREWITRPQPPPENITQEDCNFNGIRLTRDQTIKDNCNECTCERYGEKYELRCEKNVCLVDPQIIDTVSRNPTQFGWTATNYSQFWGRTLNDGVRFRLGTLMPQNFVLKMNPVRRIYDPRNLPREFDTEEFWPGYISGIQDQQWCGSSWAISTAAVASDRYAIVSRGVEAVKLSAQNLISCDLAGQQSCNGGHLDRAWSFVKAFGLVDEDCFPYVAHNSTCTIRRRGTLQEARCRPPSYAGRTARYSVGPAYRLGNETDIMFEIVNSGPVQATMKVYQDFFTYSGGIYKHTDLDLYREHGYHSVRIIGWGEENTSNGYQKYWKVANSWGTEWGEDGYFRIVRGSNECEIESFVLATWPRVERKVLLAQQDRVPLN